MNLKILSDWTKTFIFLRKFSNVPLTHESFKKISRKPFNRVTEKDLNFFRRVLDNNRVVTDQVDILGYNTDWMDSFRGEGSVVLKPKTVDELSAIMKHCNQQLLAVVPQSGNTGLVGGSVPVFDEIVISMSLMNKIHSIDEVSGNVVTQSGIVLEKLEQEVNKHNLTIPLDLGSKGSCQIGGNISTNAGGIRYLRYGSLHGNVLGLKVVLPDGEVLDCLTSLRKDSTGYDLKQLFIGAEGTLGIITDVSLFCPSKPVAVNVGYLGCTNFDDVLGIFKLAKFKLGEILSAFELIDRESIKCVVENLKLKSPLETEHEFCVLIETSGSNQGHDQEKLNDFLDEAMQKGFVKDGIIAQDMTQIKKIWEVRENILPALTRLPFWYFDDISMSTNLMKDFHQFWQNQPKDWQEAKITGSMFGHMGDGEKIWEVRENINMSCKRVGYVYKFDYTVDPNVLRDLIDVVKKEFDYDEHNVLKIVGYGHIGDGNLHLNLVTPKYCSDFSKKLETFVYSWLKDRRGSISAEHGLGIKKSDYLHYTKSPESIKYMQLMKNLFDPKGIMNPYKYLPEQAEI